jgi:hypothetical protein
MTFLRCPTTASTATASRCDARCATFGSTLATVMPSTQTLQVRQPIVVTGGDVVNVGRSA